MNNNTQDIETTNKTIINDEEISTKDMSTILQILSLEKQNNKECIIGVGQHHDIYCYKQTYK